MNNNDELYMEIQNVNMELVFCGSLYKSPDLYVKYSNSIKPQYDFSDPSCRFFYEHFENWYLSGKEDMSENKFNNHMMQDMDAYRQYKAYGGWKFIKNIMNLAGDSDAQSAYAAIKKFALIREYVRVGFPADKLLSLENFQRLSAEDVYKIMRSKCDKINTEIANIDEPTVLTEGTVALVDHYLDVPEFGITSCFRGFNEFFRGYLKSKVLFNGCMSNEGKSRYMTKIICDIALKQRKPCLLLSNEQTENDFHNALITTVVCNPEFHALHGVEIHKPEKEITMGMYRSDKTKEVMFRKIDHDGNFLETK